MQKSLAGGQIDWPRFVESGNQVHHTRGFSDCFLSHLQMLTHAEHLERTKKERKKKTAQEKAAKASCRWNYEENGHGNA